MAEMNRSELRILAQKEGLPPLSYSCSAQDLFSLITGETEVDEEHIDPLQDWREKMEKHIQDNYRRLRTQLPGCTGKCTKFGCPDLIVTRCWDAFRGQI